MKSCNMGGQAVIEGVMMRYRNSIAVSVRKSDGSIRVGLMKYISSSSKHPALKWPLVRGVVAFIDSLSLGIRTLMYSASIFEEEAEEKDKTEEKKSQVVSESMEEKSTSKGEAALMTGTVLFSLVVSVALFVLLLGETVGLWYVLTQLVFPPEMLWPVVVCYQCSLAMGMLMIVSMPYNATIIAYERMTAFAGITVFPIVCIADVLSHSFGSASAVTVASCARCCPSQAGVRLAMHLLLATPRA